MASGGTMFHVVDVQSGAVLSRHRDRDSADEMWGPEITLGEVEVIDLTKLPASDARPAPTRSFRS